MADLLAGFGPTALVFFKFTGIVLAGAFGWLGLLTNYRHPETGRPTAWGRFALAGILVSTLTAAGSQAIEMRLAQETAQREQRQVAVQLHELRRLGSPLEPLRFVWRYEAPLEQPALAPYRQRLNAWVQAQLARPELAGVALQQIGFNDEEPIWPRRNDARERAMSDLVRGTNFELRVYLDPVDLRDGAQLPPPDLKLDPGAAGGFLLYDVASGGISARVQSEDVAQEGNGRIWSAVDFENAQIVIRVMDESVFDLEAPIPGYDRAATRDVRRAIALRSWVIEFPRGRRLEAVNDSTRAIQDEYGYRVFVTQLRPDSWISCIASTNGEYARCPQAGETR